MRDGCNSYFLFWAIFCPFTPLTTKNIKILKKMKKTPGDIILNRCTENNDYMMYGSLNMVWTDGWTDGWTDERMGSQIDGQTDG